MPVVHDDISDSHREEVSTSNENKGQKKIVHLEIIMKEVQFEGKKSHIIILKNINQLISNQSQRMQSQFQEAITATISHEQMNPLNSIINFTDHLLKKTNIYLE